MAGQLFVQKAICFAVVYDDMLGSCAVALRLYAGMISSSPVFFFGGSELCRREENKTYFIPLKNEKVMCSLRRMQKDVQSGAANRFEILATFHRPQNNYREPPATMLEITKKLTKNGSEKQNEKKVGEQRTETENKNTNCKDGHG